MPCSCYSGAPWSRRDATSSAVGPARKRETQRDRPMPYLTAQRHNKTELLYDTCRATPASPSLEHCPSYPCFTATRPYGPSRSTIEWEDDASSEIQGKISQIQDGSEPCMISPPTVVLTRLETRFVPLDRLGASILIYVTQQTSLFAISGNRPVWLALFET